MHKSVFNVPNEAGIEISLVKRAQHTRTHRGTKQRIFQERRGRGLNTLLLLEQAQSYSCLWTSIDGGQQYYCSVDDILSRRTVQRQT